MNLTQKQIAILAAGALLLLVGGYFAYTNLRSNSAPPKVTLTVWGTEPDDYFAAISSLYARVRPNVTLNYTEKDPGRYEEELLDALAAGTGPDIVMIGNASVGRMQNKLAPAPEAQFTAAQMAELFPLVVSQDFVREGRVYAVPFYLDTLSLFYNKELFDQGGVVDPPRTWEDFRSTVARLRVVDADGRIERPAAAIGGSENSVVRAADIVLSLMLQNGVEMLSQTGAPNFATERGENAFTFYLQFANSNSTYYTWNDSGNSLARFAAGEVAMAFGYASDYEAMKLKNPYLRAGIAPMPQVSLSQGRAIARYDGFAVVKQSREPGWAWDFAIISTTYPQIMEAYEKASARPAALKSLIAKRTEDAGTAGIFARQALIARSWNIPNDLQAGGIWNGMIREAISGKEPLQALRDAEERMTVLYR